jgi:hypothetical protein
MNTTRFWRKPAALALGGASLLAALAAHAAFNPPIHMANGVEYMSGGISSDEAALMQTVSARWPATFEFAIKDGTRADFAADVAVTVRDATGRNVLSQVGAEGPFMVARLDPGHYEVEATLAGRTLKQAVDIHAGIPTRTLFLWPAGTDVSAHS